MDSQFPQTASGVFPPDPPDPLELPGKPLLARVIGGDGEATGRWFRAEQGPVWRLCFGFSAGAGHADDLAQDALMHILDRLHQWDSSRPYRPWRTALVLNFCRDRCRRKRTQRLHEERAALSRPERPLPDPGKVASQAEIRRLLVRTLGSIPAREREAFVLRDLEGHATDEVALSMGISASSVRSLLTLARRRLRTLLDPALDPAGQEGQRG